MQRVSSEIQPMLNSWKEAVTSEVSRLHSAESDWIRDFSTGLAELRDSASRRVKTEETLRGCYEKLAAEGGVGPKLVKKVEEQAISVAESLAKLQAIVGERCARQTHRSKASNPKTVWFILADSCLSHQAAVG